MQFYSTQAPARALGSENLVHDSFSTLESFEEMRRGSFTTKGAAFTMKEWRTTLFVLGYLPEKPNWNIFSQKCSAVPIETDNKKIVESEFIGEKSNTPPVKTKKLNYQIVWVRSWKLGSRREKSQLIRY